MNVHYSTITYKLLADHKYEIWAEEELMKPPSKIEEFKRVAGGDFESHCPLGLCTLDCNL